MSRLHFDSLMMKQQGKPDAGKPHVRFDEGEASRPCWAGTSLLYLSRPKKSAPESFSTNRISAINNRKWRHYGSDCRA